MKKNQKFLKNTDKNIKQSSNILKKRNIGNHIKKTEILGGDEKHISDNFSRISFDNTENIESSNFETFIRNSSQKNTDKIEFGYKNNIYKGKGIDNQLSQKDDISTLENNESAKLRKDNRKKSLYKNQNMEENKEGNNISKEEPYTEKKRNRQQKEFRKISRLKEGVKTDKKIFIVKRYNLKKKPFRYNKKISDKKNYVFGNEHFKESNRKPFLKSRQTEASSASAKKDGKNANIVIFHNK